MSSMPPPLPKTGQSDNAFANGASQVCLVAPLLVFGLGYVFSLIKQNLTGSNVFLAALAYDCVSLLLMVTGLITGILALLLMKSGGRARIVFRSLSGLAMIGLYFAIFIPNFVRARNIALARRAAIGNASATTNSFNQPADGLAKSDGHVASQKEFTAAVEQWGNAYAAQIHTLGRSYSAASNELAAAHVLSTSNLTAREEIRGREVVVQNFINRTTDLKKFVSQAEGDLRVALVRLNPPPGMVESTIEGFHKHLASQTALSLEITSQDERMGNGMLAVLDLLDFNWDRWSYDQANGHVRFQSPDLAAQYNADLREIQRANTERAAAEDRFVSASSRASMP